MVMIVGAPGFEDFEGRIVDRVTTCEGCEMVVILTDEPGEMFVFSAEYVVED